VVFCDLVGSTALSGKVDPEDLRGIIGAYHRCCTEVIERNGGFVAKYMGDGVLAYFGYPQAHERAVRAGLNLAQAVPKVATHSGPPLEVRVGIATGLVVVGDLIGAGAAQEQAVVGETPNLAARLQASAEPGRALLRTCRHFGCWAWAPPRRLSAATRTSTCSCAVGSKPSEVKGELYLSRASLVSASRASPRPSRSGSGPSIMTLARAMGEWRHVVSRRRTDHGTWSLVRRRARLFAGELLACAA
jgi:hypothetical protein